MKKTFYCSVFIFILLSLFLPYRAQALSVGQEAPYFNLKLFEGSTISLADLKGKPIVLNFWASW